MGGMLEDAERRIDEERARWQQRKAKEAEEKAKRDAAEKARRQNSNSWLF